MVILSIYGRDSFLHVLYASGFLDHFPCERLFYSVMLGGKRALRFGRFSCRRLIFTALLNPAFNHQGVTILFI
jgi:hypothetical protein